VWRGCPGEMGNSMLAMSELSYNYLVLHIPDRLLAQEVHAALSWTMHV
jgi:hypothetical protein